jgi:TATA-box binding protein (TBP) (component of TFIID and TFIIIB)
MSGGSIDVRVENQLVRFVCPVPLDHEKVVSEVGGQRNSGVVIKAMDRPRATLVVDEEGRIVVHGTHRLEAARAAAKELLLRLGMDDSGLVAEMGPVVASFQYEQAINLQAIPATLPSGTAEFDERLGCTTLTDQRHNLTVQIWPNGKCIVADARHANMVAMAAVYWKSVFEERGFFVEHI